jgi:hypothetical protein
MRYTMPFQNSRECLAAANHRLAGDQRQQLSLQRRTQSGLPDDDEFVILRPAK